MAAPVLLDLTTAGSMVVAGLAVCFFVLIVFGVRSGSFLKREAVVLGVWNAGVLAVAVRRAMLGVWVSPVGVRSRSLLRTTTVPWASVVEIRSGTSSIAGLDMDATRSSSSGPTARRCRRRSSPAPSSGRSAWS
ncbi:PH domain-containing protein [Micromonospora sp. BRA006-A]|nr:PH domain-containing protein [Micromonospora sp. BRA006-A]